ncbi:DsbA family protein [Streptacidiphilus anmyonensis]|uniref:DsbA family protein n=1 Tax=Streptacidiphilus anmyonensis TaxID=405782 RepID=UPI00069393FE|nr:thioredoxin domain-containing protein [Streptacidiphilus anmyonensis]
MKSSTDNNPQQAGASVRKTPWRRWLVAGGVVVAIFVVAGLIGSVVRADKATQLAPPAGAVGTPALAVPEYGHAAVTLTVYEDLRDPATLAFENTYGATLRQLVSSGVANVYYHETAGVDATQGGSGSLDAGNALGCALDDKKFADYRAVLLNHQPAESDDAFASKSGLILLAKKVKGLDTDVFRACVNNGDHNVWVQDSTKAFTALNLGAAPVLQMQSAADAAAGNANATTIVSASQSLTPQQLQDRVLAAAVSATPVSGDLPSIAVTNGATPTPTAPLTPSASASPKAKAAKDKKKPTATTSPSASVTP